MKSIKTTAFLCCTLVWALPILALPSITSVTTNTPSVGRYQKWELKAVLANTSYTNAYDFAQARLACVLTAPSGATKTIDGFWKNGYTITNITNGTLSTNAADNGWYVRFSPTETGTWSYSLSFTDAGGTSTAVTGSFSCTASADKGFVRRQAGKNYFQYDNGTSYIPIGQNLCWYNGNGLGDLKSWIDPMATNNANYLRYWLCYWATELEWTATQYNYPYAGLKQYEQRRAFELDWLVDYAAQKGVYIDLCLQNHGQIQDPNVAGNYSPQWDTNPYSSALGGPCTSPSNYWVNATGKTIYKNKLRYIIARWGYSPNILTWEFFNELNLTENYAANAANASAWVNEMAAYMKTTDPNAHLTSNSYTSTSVGAADLGNANLDIPQVHYYDGDNTAFPPSRANYETVIATQAQTMTSTYNKPFLTGEFGLFTDDQNGNTAAYDPNGVMMHNVMWSTLLNGSAGAGFTWWWDSYTHPLSTKTYKIFKQLADFTSSNMNVVAKNYQRITPTFTGTGVLGNATVSPQYAGFHPPTYAPSPAPSNSFTLSSDGSLSPAAANLSTILFNAYHIAAKNPPTFNVNYPASGQFKVTVAGRGSSSSSTLVVIVDGVTVLTQANPANTTYSVNIASGMHTIKVDNTGNEWIQISDFTFTNYVPSPVAVNSNALRDGNHVIGWLLNRDYNWQYLRDHANVAPPSVSNASMQLSGMTTNKTYTIQFFNTETNTLINSVNATSDGAGLLTIPMPTLAWDASFRIEAAQPIPIELLSFSGEMKEKTTVLTQWRTATEQNTRFFEVQRSNDGLNFVTLGKVAAAGQSAKIQSYYFEDLKPKIGVNYYRLKVNDVDGKVSFSNTISVFFSDSKTDSDNPSVLSLTTYPNPTSEDVNVRFELKNKAKMTVTLTDLNGRSLYTFQETFSEGIHNFVLPTQDLAQGVYVLTMRSDEGRGVVKKIVKR